MIKSIHIQHFRCFEDFKLQGVGQVNLIGGLNNSGKTVLLEAVSLGMIPRPKHLIRLKQERFLNKSVLEEEAESIFWDDFFFNRDKSKTIAIEIDLKDNRRVKHTYKIQKDIFSLENALEISYIHNQQRYYTGLLSFENSIPTVTQKEYQPDWDLKLNTALSFLNTKPVYNIQELIVKKYSGMELNGEEKYLLEGFQIIDNSISEIKIISLNQPSLYLKRENEPLMPMVAFGDAISKIAEIVTAIISNKGGLMLIDEIENGIHSSKQTAVWGLIFRLALKFEVQIFATTHSKEMALAFNTVALEQESDQTAKYIEMMRHFKTKKIKGLVYDRDMLQYKLNRNKAFRGE